MEFCRLRRRMEGSDRYESFTEISPRENLQYFKKIQTVQAIQTKQELQFVPTVAFFLIHSQISDSTFISAVKFSFD
jgi:hypothetical protein